MLAEVQRTARKRRVFIVVLELVWKNKIMDYAMPYFIQVLKEYLEKIDQLQAFANTVKETEEIANSHIPLTLARDQLMLTGPGFPPQNMAPTPYGPGMMQGGMNINHMGSHNNFRGPY